MVGTALLVGSVLGVRHALEADHVAAVATLVEEKGRPASAGAAWGIGHSLPIAVLGALFLALDLRLPPVVAAAIEVVVALVLVALGIRVLADREAIGTVILRHMHRNDGDRAEGGHLHVSIGGTEIGLAHSHADEESLAVGIVHGLAGSGGIVVVLASAAPTVPTGAAFLIGFSVASIFAMGLAAWGWGRALGRTTMLRKVAGVASIAIGLLMLVEIARIV